MDGQPIFITFAWAIQKGRPVYCPLILSFNFPEHPYATIFPGVSIISSPVAGFLTLHPVVVAFLLGCAILGNILDMLV